MRPSSINTRFRQISKRKKDLQAIEIYLCQDLWRSISICYFPLKVSGKLHFWFSGGSCRVAKEVLYYIVISLVFTVTEILKLFIVTFALFSKIILVSKAAGRTIETISPSWVIRKIYDIISLEYQAYNQQN